MQRLNLYHSELTPNNLKFTGSQFFSYHPMPEERKQEMGLNPGSLTPQATAPTTTPWLLSVEIGVRNESLDLGDLASFGVAMSLS